MVAWQHNGLILLLCLLACLKFRPIMSWWVIRGNRWRLYCASPLGSWHHDQISQARWWQVSILLTWLTRGSNPRHPTFSQCSYLFSDPVQSLTSVVVLRCHQDVKHQSMLSLWLIDLRNVSILHWPGMLEIWVQFPLYVQYLTIWSHPWHWMPMGGELAQLVRARGYMTLGTGVRIPVMAVTFSCAAIHLPAVYNLQRHQRSNPLISCLYSVGG